jgi:hypothetical protein
MREVGSAAHLERGAVYRFCVSYVLASDDPYGMFPIDMLDAGA